MKNINVFGRKISALALGMTLMLTLAAASLLTYYGMFTGTADVSQSVLVDGLDVNNGSLDLALAFDDVVAGETYLELHTFENRADVPADVGFLTGCNISGTEAEPNQTVTFIDWSNTSTYKSREYCDGITTSYLEWNESTAAITPGSNGGVSMPTAIYDDSDELYKIWYVYNTGFIRYAESSDGVAWNAQDTDILETNDCPFVMKEGDTYYMVNYKAGNTNEFYIYTSGNGITWEDGTLIFTNPLNTKWEKIDNPKIIKDGDEYRMYYQAKLAANGEYYILSAASDELDGNYTGSSNSVLQPGADGSWDDYRIMQPMVVKSGDYYLMMYTGYSHADTEAKTGYAVSEDGIAWTKVDVSTEGYDLSFGTSAWKNSLVNVDGKFVLFYLSTGANNGIYQTELVPLDTTTTLSPGTTKGFFVVNDFDVRLAPNKYTITAGVTPY